MKQKMNIKFLCFTLIFSGLCAGYFPASTDAQSIASRVGDNQMCPRFCSVGPISVAHIGGPILTGSSTVLICGIPAARLNDVAQCANCAVTTKISSGSGTVLINGLPAARKDDRTTHTGTVTTGCPTVLIGG